MPTCRPRHACLSALVIVSLLLSLTPPVVYAQSNGPIYLPLIANGETFATTALIFRTHITVNTSAQWQDLTRLGLTVLDQGVDWALVLVDDEQLADLARLRFTPTATNALETLATANVAVASALQPLLSQAKTVRQQLDALALAATVQAADTTQTAPEHTLFHARLAAATGQLEQDGQVVAVRTSLRTALHALGQTEQGALVAVISVDTDKDGLTDDEEGYWCTDPAKADSDGDGVSDGAEVAKLQDWLGNKLAGPPSTGKPFLGWPPQKQNCFDDDQDSVPDIAESTELGLNPNLESTDHDKFDDGQELFGTTYCTGQGGYCSYGLLPRNDDWGIIGAQMPAWVKAPGNHPLAAAFPMPEIGIVESSFKVVAVTDITTDHKIAKGEEQSYNTAKMEGTSSSVADTATWNEWQEVSINTPLAVSSAQSASTSIRDETKNSLLEWRMGDFRLKIEPKIDLCVPVLKIFVDVCAGELAFDPIVSEPESIPFPPDLKVDLKNPNLNLDSPAIKDALKGCFINSSGELECKSERVPSSAETAKQDDPTTMTQDRNIGGSGQRLSSDGKSITIQRSTQYSAPVPRIPPSRTETSGRSVGGAKTTTHSAYEEYTVTNGEAFSNEESWGNATAVDSVHSADLTFTYKVRNTGKEYAREMANLAFNLYIGNDPNPAYTYFVAPDIGGSGKFQNFMPDEEHTYNSKPIPLNLNQMKAIDLGGPIRIVAEDFTYGADELFYQDASKAGVMVAIEDGTEDGDENIDTYLLPTWKSSETVLQVLTRSFPNATDTKGNITAIWTPEYRSDTPAWCQSPRRPTDYPNKAVWCKHLLSSADWWNVYTNGLGDSSEGFQKAPAVPGSVVLFRFNKDTDLDGFSDRSEKQLGTDPTDAASFPHPELLAGLNSIRSGNKVTSTLSLLNQGVYDAYGIEAIMIAPNDSISITNNTVGGSGRVRALKQVIVGSSIKLPTPLPSPWTQSDHAQIGAGGYYTGTQDRIYTFAVACANPGGCKVGEGTWNLNWNDGASKSGSLPFGSGYASPTFQRVGDFGVTLALYTGKVSNGDSFTVNARTPRDTFQYTINREPHTDPLVIVSYNDPQGNHRFMLPPAALQLKSPTDDLHTLAGTMLQNAGVEMVTRAPFQPGNNHLTLLVNNPVATSLTNAHLFVEFINISGTVVSEAPRQVSLPSGPTTVSVDFSSNAFNPPYNANQDYIVMAFLTDYQGNILGTAGRPLSSFQADPLPKLTSDDASLNWNFGSAPQGALLKHPLMLANTGFGRLYTYIQPATGLTLDAATNAAVGAADQSSYQLTLRTSDLPVGPYDRTITLATSDMANPTRTLHVQGTVTALLPDAPGGVLQRPLDVSVTVTGTHSAGEWVDFSHNLGPDSQSLQPVKVYSQDYGTLFGVGKYATDFGSGSASSNMFGTGTDGNFAGGDPNPIRVTLAGNVSIGQTNLLLNDNSQFKVGDEIFVVQVVGANAGNYEFRKVVNKSTNSLILEQGLTNSYSQNGSQVLRVPQFNQVTGSISTGEWNGSTGGYIIFRAFTINDATIEGSVKGFKGGRGNGAPCGNSGVQGESWAGGGSCGRSANGGGGGAGDIGNSDPHWGAGGGGGYGSVGGNGAGALGGAGGSGYGDTLLTQLFLGSGGGGGAWGTNPYGGGRNSIQGNDSSGQGAGAIYIAAQNITNLNAYANGNIGGNSNGSYGGYAGGGGSGGSIKIIGGQVALGTVQAAGGSGGNGTLGSGGAGSVGRIRVEYCNTLNGTTNPLASTQKLNCYIAEQVETPPYTNARLNLPETFTDKRTYNVQFGRKLDFTQAGEQVTTLRVPAGLLASATLDVLAQTVTSGNLALKLDIGNDGSWDWETTQSVTTATTFASPNLFVAFNAFWQQHGAPLSGNLDIPVKVYLSQAATVQLTNLTQVNLTAMGTGTQLNPRPLDVTAVVTGTHAQSEWINLSHNLGPDPQDLQPVKVYGQDYTTLLGVGKYATTFGQGTTSTDMFGDGRDGVMLGSGNLDNEHGFGVGIVNSGSVGSTSISVIDASNVARINPGDVVLIHQTQGSNAGCWEINKAVSDFGGGAAMYQLTTPLKCSYVSDSGNNHAQILRVPQYSTCNVTGTVTPLAAWNGGWGGIFAVMCSKTMSVLGAVDASRTGFRGGIFGDLDTRHHTGQQGESYPGPGIYNTDRLQFSHTQPNGGGGGGGGEAAGGSGNGGGGGYGAAGQTVPTGGLAYGLGGNVYGDTALNQIHLGSGGGGTFWNYACCATAADGGDGGGIIVLFAHSLSINGELSSNGENGARGSGGEGSGGGSGGSIKLIVGGATLQNGAIIAKGGVGGDSSYSGLGGNGGTGRIRVEYCESLTGTTNPPASTAKLNCYIVEQTGPNTARLNLPTAVNGSATYNVQFGRMITFTAASNQVTSLRVPVGMMSSAKLDLLVSGLTADANISLDVGSDGVVDWNGAFANNSTTTSPDVAAAFNAYWTSHGAPATGTLDVPVRVTSSGAGQLLLTNLQVSSASSNLRYVRVSAQNYAKFLLDFTAGTSGAVVAALDVGDNGSIDWNSPAPGAAPMRWKTGDLSSALNAYLAGKSGEQLVPIRFYLSPSGAVTLNDYEASVAAVTDLTAIGINVGGGAVTAVNVAVPSIKQGDTVNVTAQLRNAGNVASGPVTVAFFANAMGWGDWYIGSQFFPSIAANTPVIATVPWNTTGFSGTVPVKVVINPYKRVTENFYTNNSASTTANVVPPALPPVTDFSAAPTSGNAPLTVQFTNTTTATLTALLWKFGDGATSSAPKPSHVYSNPGVYTVTLTVTATVNGVSSSDTKVRSRYITAGTPLPPVPTANFSATPTSGNAPLAVQFTDLSTGNVTGWQWSFGDGATAATQHPAHSYSATGAYTVTLTASGPGGSNTLRRSAFVNVATGQVRVDIPLAPSWNLVALPVLPANSNVDQVLASISGKYNLVYAYKGCDTADPWKKYDPAAPPFANDLSTLDLTMGLWVRMTTTATLSVTGLAPISTSIPLCNGWNLVGYPAQQARTVGDAFTALNGCYSMVYGYVAADLADVWKKYDPAAPPFANDLTTLNPGRGYWIKANQACTWVVNR